jgi:phage baseplate assembly protein W
VTLDVRESSNLSDFGLYSKENVTDIEQSIDYEAISNSITNIFNTTPGQKLLNPEFGLALRQYLFEPLSYDIAENIGETILLGITEYEPRVRVLHVHVIIDFDAHEYEITLKLAVPALNNSKMTISGSLDTDGFTSTDTSDFDR